MKKINKNFLARLTIRAIFINTIAYGAFLWGAIFLVSKHALMPGDETRFSLPYMALVMLIFAGHHFMKIKSERVSKNSFSDLFFYMNTAIIYFCLDGYFNSSVISYLNGILCLIGFILIYTNTRPKIYSDRDMASGIAIILMIIPIIILLMNIIFIGRVV